MVALTKNSTISLTRDPEKEKQLEGPLKKRKKLSVIVAELIDRIIKKIFQGAI